VKESVSSWTAWFKFSLNHSEQSESCGLAVGASHSFQNTEIIRLNATVFLVSVYWTVSHHPGNIRHRPLLLGFSPVNTFLPFTLFWRITSSHFGAGGVTMKPVCGRKRETNSGRKAANRLTPPCWQVCDVEYVSEREDETFLPCDFSSRSLNWKRCSARKVLNWIVLPNFWEDLFNSPSTHQRKYAKSWLSN